MPILFIYNSASEKTGILGFGWHSPQLESSAVFERDGVLWTAPWGEKIKFFDKEEKEHKDAVKIELYDQARKGRGFFAPYSDWEAVANASENRMKQAGNWTFSGKRRYKGWKFVYREAQLRFVTAPSGRSISFEYAKRRPVKIVQNGTALAEFKYDKDTMISAVVNGVANELKYVNAEAVILPKTVSGKIVRTMRPRLFSLQTGELNPVFFSYRDGYLSGIRRGGYTDEITVETVTLQEHIANLRSKDSKSRTKVKHSGKVGGRILSDTLYKYSYTGDEPGKVRLTNRMNQTARYDFNHKTGVFSLTEFSGKSFTIYYFMRYDVAYLGKVRKIVDGKGRDVVNYRYDKLSGNVLRVRDMAENDINFSYYANGNLKEISRRGAEQDKPEPVTAFRYDSEGNPSEISRLDHAGNAVQTTSIRYDRRQPVQVSGGLGTVNISYSRFGYPVSVKNAFGQVRYMDYDNFNRLSCMTDIYGAKTFYTYTSAGLVCRIERKDGEELFTAVDVVYDGNGYPVSYTDQSGRQKRFERDSFGRVVRELFPDDTSVEYEYNRIGQLQQVQDQNSNSIRFNWDKFGLDGKRTAAGQLTDYVRDKFGMLTAVRSKKGNSTDRNIRYEYDKLDRLIKVTYADNETETFSYDTWGRLVSSVRGGKKALFKYDYFGRLAEKHDGPVVHSYTYNKWGQRTGRTTKNGSLVLSEKMTYDKFGRLTSISSGGKTVQYAYNRKNQLIRQIIDGVPVDFTYTKYGQLKGKTLGGNAPAVPFKAVK